MDDYQSSTFEVNRLEIRRLGITEWLVSQIEGNSSSAAHSASSRPMCIQSELVHDQQ